MRDLKGLPTKQTRNQHVLLPALRKGAVVCILREDAREYPWIYCVEPEGGMCLWLHGLSKTPYL